MINWSQVILPLCWRSRATQKWEQLGAAPSWPLGVWAFPPRKVQVRAVCSSLFILQTTLQERLSLTLWTFSLKHFYLRGNGELFSAELFISRVYGPLKYCYTRAQAQIISQYVWLLHSQSLVDALVTLSASVNLCCCSFRLNRGAKDNLAVSLYSNKPYFNKKIKKRFDRFFSLCIYSVLFCSLTWFWGISTYQ